MKSSKNIKMLGKTVPMKKERGASSLEYLVLAAVIIAILLFLNSDNTIKTKVQTTFSSLFDKADITETIDE